MGGKKINPDLTKIEILRGDLLRFKQAKIKEEVKTGVRLLQPAFLSLLINDGIRTRGIA